MRKLFNYCRNKVLTVFGDIHINRHFPWIPYYKPEGYSICGEHIRKLLEICKPGDVLLRGYDDYFDGLLIGKWSHAALIFDETRVIHAIAEGVKMDDLLDFFKTDRIMVLRPIKLTPEELKKVRDKALYKLGTRYDFGFNFNNPKELCCTELVYHCFEDYADILGMYKEQESLLGIKRQTVRPFLFTKFKGFEKIKEFSF